MDIAQLETPALVLDRARLDRNLGRMREHLARLGVRLRPHVKTAKSMDVVLRALDGQPGGITASTLAEAERFFRHGVTDILYAVGVAPGVIDTNQEHGILAGRRGGRVDVGRFPVGAPLRILPNHACATAAQHARYHVVAGGTAIEAVWERFVGW
ncbi:hypothetical protein WMF30_34645 [Sorangium sp. So ce134]